VVFRIHGRLIWFETVKKVRSLHRTVDPVLFYTYVTLRMGLEPKLARMNGKGNQGDRDSRLTRGPRTLLVSVGTRLASSIQLMSETDLISSLLAAPEYIALGLADHSDSL
jgi:hypothetical protein